MGTNQFYSYATTGGSLNVESLPSYLADTIRLNGAVAGIAQAAPANRAWRQGANMASAIGEAIILKTALDALDDGSIVNLRDAIIAMIVASAQPYIPPGLNVFTFTGNSTLVLPSWVTHIRVKMVGGGGGAAGGNGTYTGGGGGAGAYIEGVFAIAVPGDTITISAGSGGTGGTGGNSGGDGTSSFVSWTATALVAEHGYGGTFGAAPAGGGGGGLPSNGDIREKGGMGTDGTPNANTLGGVGGASFFGGGGRSSTAYNSAIQDGRAHGSGGGAGYANASVRGGDGAGGFVLIEY